MYRHVSPRLPLLAAAVLTAALQAQGTPIGFEETWALAPDRSKAVAQLIPGTDDWYYYHCRERLSARDFATVQKVLPAWIDNHGRTARVMEIENRHALLTYASDPGATFAFLQQRLSLQFDHQRIVPGERSDLPVRLDPELLANAALTQRALARHPGSVDGFTDSALAGLLSTNLDAITLRSLLERLTRPDVDNLPALIVRDLEHRGSGAFGSKPVHRLLRRAQLDECARLRPALLRERAFVDAYLVRLQPSADVDWQLEPVAMRAQLVRLWEFAQRLPPAHNSLKAHVLFHLLQHDLTQGAPDKERFRTYIRLPRRSGYPSAAHLQRHQRGDEFVDGNTKFPTGLPAIGDDTALVRACLEHFFVREDSYEPYAEFLDADWLKVVLAETKILLGDGDMERWYSLLSDPAHLDRLEQRVEIGFPPTQSRQFAANEAVTLAVDTKNVPLLLVKVFAIDSYRFHQEKQADVDATIDLDGVVANFEQTFTYTEPKLRRVRRTFDLPMLREPGTYIVEFVGNGLSSRAVVHKGWLRHAERTTAAGHVFRVYDEAGTLLKDANLWFGNREYAADDDGEILLPFSSEPGRHKVVLRHGNRSSLSTFAHQGESYELHGAAHVDRESLIAGKKAQLLVRPQLRLGQNDVSLQLLTQPVLTIVANDLDGLETKQDVHDITLVDQREFVHEITVPERLASLRVSLRGIVRDLVGKDVALQTAVSTFAVNGMDVSPATSSVMLQHTASGYALEVRGKNGEARGGQTIQLRLRHRHYRETIDVALQSDPAGRITLGDLPGIDEVHVRQANGFEGSFQLRTAMSRRPASLHGLAGDTLRIPYQGLAAAASRTEFSLLGVESDAFDHLAIVDGFLELRDLEPGDYELQLHAERTTIAVRITRGQRDGGWLVGTDRILAAATTLPLHLRTIDVDGDELLVRLGNASSSTRVHIAATRYVPAFVPFFDLHGAPAKPARELLTERATSSYHAGRTLGDEYRYVLDRRFAVKYPGNMLRRPSMLLNPWSVEDSRNEATGLGGGAGGRYGGRRAGGKDGRPGGPSTGGPGAATINPGSWANLDYLSQAVPQLGNLTPSADGTIRVKLADLGTGHIVHVLAIDGDQLLYDTMHRPELPLQTRPRDLAQALDGAQHFVEHKRIEFVAAGSEAVLADARSAQVEIYDSLASVHRLLSTISRDESLQRFAFVLQWPTFDAAKKQQLYSEHACHELHFFLHAKDPEFFAAVVAPYLANKLDKTFLDEWLLGSDLRAHLEPRSFARLNLIEKILLAQRLDGEQQRAVARALREELELRPPSLERIEHLFKLALKSNELADAGDEVRAGLTVGQTKAPGAPAPTAAVPPAEDAPALRQQLEDKAEKEAGAPPDAATGADDFHLGKNLDAKLGEELKRRKDVRGLYRAVEATKLLVEQNYWQRRMAQTTSDVVQPNRFWIEYATKPAGQPFASAAIVEAGGSFLEAMMALAVLDLPFAAGKHEVTADGDRRTLRAASPLLLVRKEVTRTEKAADQAPLLLGENFFRLDDRYVFDSGPDGGPDGGGERRDRFVTDEFLADVAYGCQVVVTNPTSSKRTAELLLQIPAGALPLQRGFWTRGVPVELQPYATATIEYAFYFPATGDFAHYPVHAAEKGRLAASAEPRTLRVVATPTRIDTTSWEHVSQQGSAEEVLSFLDRSNVLRLDLDKLAWRLKDRSFFTTLLDKLRARHVYHGTLWSYAILHQDPDATREYLRHADQFLQQCGTAITSPLVTIDPIERRLYEHIELDPLVHARAHKLGSRRMLGNVDLARQYAALMDLLGYHEKLDSADWMGVTYYLLLQDRIEEALASFGKIDPTQVATQIQFDYLRAYLCFFTGDTQTARATAERHREHPVPHWRKRFTDVLAQLDEAEGKAPGGGDTSTQDLAATAPALELSLDGRSAKVVYRNLAACEVRYYELDVEFAFSAQPFQNDQGGSAAFVQPTLQQAQNLPAGQEELVFALPAEFHQKNVLVEVRAAGLVRAQTYFANALAVRFLESYGQVAVSEPGTDTPLPKTYVKVFAKLPNGTVRFHKDGYTDLRGRFDYASLSDDPNAGATRYAVLVLSEQRGAVIREMNPPTK